MHHLLAVLLLASPVDTGATAASELPPDASPPASKTSPVGGTEVRSKLFGLQLSAGAPEGFGLSAAIRPIDWLRGTVGFSHNVLGPGVTASATLLPFRFAVVPTLTLEAGKFFETDVSSEFSGTLPSGLDPALQKFGYTYLATQLGLEIGSQRSFVFFLRGGLAWVRSDLGDVHGVRQGNTTVDVTNPRLRATVPTANLGFLFYVW